MDSELHFEWPTGAGRQSVRTRTGAARQSVSRPAEERPTPGPRSDAGHLQGELDEARATIAELKAACGAAGRRIDELEAAHDGCQARLTAQRRRLLVLERQLEGVSASPAKEEASRPASWLDRLLGGPPALPTP